MKNLKILFLTLIIISLSFQCTRDKSAITGFETENPPDSIVVRKPNIYIYPEEKIDLRVEISFPIGGKILTSEPPYTDSGWNITVDKNGLIDNAYEYLFYECKIPNYFQTKEGWKVRQKNLAAFFKENLGQFGLNEKEARDFEEYWLPKLTDFEYYLIFPQKKEIIDQLIELYFSIEPDNLQRIFYLFKGVNQSTDVNINTPQYDTFDRNGYLIVEWGGMVYNL